MSLHNKIKLIANAIGRFTEQYNQNLKILQDAQDNYNNDFSLLCTQQYINALGIFPPAQYEIKMLLQEYMEEAFGKNDGGLLDVVQEELDNLSEYDLKNLLYNYINACNMFITLIKSPKIDTFEKKLEIAMPVLSEREKYLKAVNLFVGSVSDLGKELSKLD